MRTLIVALSSLAFSFGGTIGVNLQKWSMNKEEKLKNPRPHYRQPWWLVGFVIQIFDAGGDFVFIGLAPQSLLAPLGALGLGFNLIVAPIFHPEERVTRGVLVATAWIYVGTILAVLFAPETAPDYDLKQLVDLVTTPMFIFYAMLCIGFQLGWTLHGKRQKHYSMMHYCAVAGCFGGQCMQCAKCVSELVKHVIATRNIDDWTSGSPIPYIFVILMLGTVLSTVHFLNQGLAQFDALLVLPIFQTFWNVFGITGGLVLFQEYRLMTVRDGGIYAMGVLMTLVGVYMLVQSRKQLKTKTDEDEEDPKMNLKSKESDIAVPDSREEDDNNKLLEEAAASPTTEKPNSRIRHRK